MFQKIFISNFLSQFCHGRVRVGVRPFVMASVVATPLDHVVLEGHTVQRGQQHAKGPFGLVGLKGREYLKSKILEK